MLREYTTNIINRGDESSSESSSSDEDDDVTRSIGEFSQNIDQDSENRVSSDSSSESDSLAVEDMKPSARFGGMEIETPNKLSVEVEEEKF